MIDPDGIRTKAVNLFPEFLSSWLEGTSFFPRTIPASKELGGDLTVAAASVQRLRAASKTIRGFGYTIEWAVVNSRRFGRNELPKRIFFETQDDFLKFAGKEREFARFVGAVDRLRTELPQLEPWIRTHHKLLLEAADDVEALISVVDFLLTHPRPGLYLREIPGSFGTKFIGRNEGILRDWLDRMLPPENIRSDEQHFARRFGLRHPEPHVIMRFLDPQVQSSCGSPWSELSLPIESIAKLPGAPRRVLIAENKVSFLTLPLIAGAIAIGGLGNRVIDLRLVPWLSSCDIWYWGDIDVEGFEILSNLRSVFPHAQSVLMDDMTVSRWQQEIAIIGTGRSPQMPRWLTEGERHAFEKCAKENIRIEQERLPKESVDSALRTLAAAQQHRIG